MQIPVFAHVAAASTLLPMLYGVKVWKTSKQPVRMFTLFCVYSVLHVIAEFTLGRMGISNQFLSNYHQLIEFICILYLYQAWIVESKVKDFFQYVGMLYIILWLINKYYFENPEQFSDVISAAALFLLIVSTVILLHAVNSRTQGPITEHFVFWIATGVLLYSAGTITVIAFSNTILEMGIAYFDVLWHINWGFTVAANILYAKGFTCKVF